MNKKIVFIIGFLIIFFGTAFIQFHGVALPKKEETSQSFVIKQTVIDGKKTVQARVRIATGSTALQLLNTTHKIITKGQNKNAFITTIDGYTADSQKKEFWAFYVNGRQATVGAGSYVVKNNDTIVWEIETY